MKIGINIGCYGALTIEAQIKLMKENGFETCFLGCEGKDYDEVVTKLQAAGITVENLHAPFGKSKTEPICGINDMWEEGEAGEAMLGRLENCVKKAAKYSIPTIVVHLSSGTTPTKINAIGNERFDRLMQTAREYNVKIAFENQRMLGNIGHIFDYYQDAGFCWDTGHEYCFTPGREYMPLFGNKIAALHVQDNLGGGNGDLHLIPYDGVVDFEKSAKYLAESPFSGSVMLEVLKRNSNHYDDVSAEEYYKRAGEAARRLAERIEFYRNN